MATPGEWLEGARLRTLPAAIAPVFLGTGVSYGMGSGHLGKAMMAGAVALLLQVGVNFANDYSDGVRGTDEHRKGPQRLTATGAAPPRTVLTVALVNFALAAVVGLVLVAWSGAWNLLAAGAGAIGAAWFYTGGKRPYGYMGLGEVFVFIFFGWLATLGTTWTQSHALTWQAWVVASGVGLLSCALLMVNNIRDISSDTPSGKKTLAVRLGDARARAVYLLMLGLSVAGLVPVFFAPKAWWPGLLLIVILAIAAIVVARPVMRGARGMALVAVLRNTGFLTLAYGVSVGVVLAYMPGQ
ncbi:MAG: 1,4-dihydroxy-2-naphthoate polyprenyltransferase [Actinomycetaceae bacterium]|nr:1,4-dihydroxy-2-naphthoate polyprenyltransferase [Actinomycetaceae bacterium]